MGNPDAWMDKTIYGWVDSWIDKKRQTEQNVLPVFNYFELQFSKFL